MRTMFKAALLVPAMLAAAPAVAQVGAPGPVYYNGPARVSMNPPRQNIQQPRMRQGNRWGGNVGGRWYGGVQAPGGWGGYRRPSRGFQLDRYWMSSNFQIPDYYSFGLRAPANGYYWVRYYDDAVMVDSYGRVRDSVSGVSWGGASASASASDGYASSSAAAGGSYGSNRGEITRVEPNAYYQDDQGYAEDSGYAEEIPYPYTQGGYATPVAGGPPAPQCHDRCPRGGGYGASYGADYGQSSQYSGQGYSSQQSYSSGYAGSQGYTGGGYYGGGSTTTVTITYPAVTTTTVTEEVIETVSSSRASYVSRPRTKLIRRAPVRYSGKRLRRSGCGC